MVIHNQFILPLREAPQWLVTFEVYMGNPRLMAFGERKGGSMRNPRAPSALLNTHCSASLVLYLSPSHYSPASRASL